MWLEHRQSFISAFGINKPSARHEKHILTIALVCGIPIKVARFIGE